MMAHWATEYEGLGNSYGYSVHNARAREAVLRAGVELSEEAEVAVHVAPGHRFRPIAGKRNVLFMAWETDALPADHAAGVARADAVIVTSGFLGPVVRRAAPGTPVYVCPLGVDVEMFGYVERERPREGPFRFLWVGAPNARKGWELVMEAWRVFAGDGRVELYLKTTMTGRLERVGNVIFDSRNVRTEALAESYRSAHAFVFPSFGEGFGLTLAEALATGLPAAYTPWSSLRELADASCGYPVRFHLVPAWAKPNGGLSTETQPPDAKAVRTRLAQAEPDDLARRMLEIFGNYAEARRRGARAAERMRRRYTWERTGARLAAILREVGERRAASR